MRMCEPNGVLFVACMTPTLGFCHASSVERALYRFEAVRNFHLNFSLCTIDTKKHWGKNF